MRQLNREKRIFGSTKDWVIQGGVFTPFTAIIPAEAITFVLKRRFPPLATLKIIEVYLDEGDKGYWIFDREAMARLGRWCFKHPAYIKRVYRLWQTDRRVYYGVVKWLKQDGIKNILQDWLTFYRFYLDEYSLPLITEYYSVAGDDFIKKLKAKHGTSPRLDDDIVVFTSPPKLSFLQLLDLALFELARVTPKKIPPSFTEFTKKYRRLAEGLAEIRHNYFWIHFNYRDTKPLPSAYFYRRLRNILQSNTKRQIGNKYYNLFSYQTKIEKKQRRFEQSTILNPREIRILKSISFAAHWQDERKAANLIANYWCNRFLTAASQKLKMPLVALQHLTPREFISLLENGRLPKDVNKRMAGGFFYVFSNRKEVFFTGPEFKRLWQRISNISKPEGIKELPGIAASSGLYRGRVRRIETPGKEGKYLKRGEVLVAYMTRPDFMPLMHKAGAIVTDEGGLTSHAAIIARELKVPCVVGTRMAMRVLKDGDMVEVDASKGTVKKI